MGKSPLIWVNKFDIFIKYIINMTVDCHVFSYLLDGKLIEAGSMSYLYVHTPSFVNF